MSHYNHSIITYRKNGNELLKFFSIGKIGENHFDFSQIEDKKLHVKQPLLPYEVVVCRLYPFSKEEMDSV